MFSTDNPLNDLSYEDERFYFHEVDYDFPGDGADEVDNCDE